MAQSLMPVFSALLAAGVHVHVGLGPVPPSACLSLGHSLTLVRIVRVSVKVRGESQRVYTHCVADRLTRDDTRWDASTAAQVLTLPTRHTAQHSPPLPFSSAPSLPAPRSCAHLPLPSRTPVRVSLCCAVPCRANGATLTYSQLSGTRLPSGHSGG